MFVYLFVLEKELVLLFVLLVVPVLISCLVNTYKTVSMAGLMIMLYRNEDGKDSYDNNYSIMMMINYDDGDNNDR